MVKKISHLIRVLAVVLPGVTAVPAAAQDTTFAGAKLVWGLQQCIRYAIQNNTQINSLRLSKQTSEQGYLLAKAARLPGVSGSASQTFLHDNDNTRNNIVGVTGEGASASGDYAVSASVVLSNGNLLTNTIKQANLQVKSAGLNVSQEENDISIEVTQAYLAVLLDKDNIVYAADILNTSNAQLKLEQQRFTVGSVSRKDLIQIQAQTATDTYNLVAAKNSESGDLLTLKQLLLLPLGTDLDIIQPDSLLKADTVISPNQAETEAFRIRPEIKNAQYGIDIAQYSLKIAKAGYAPSLSAGATAGSGYASSDGTFPSQLGSNFYQQVALTLAVPIFTKRVVKTQVEEAKINVEQAGLTLENTKITLSQSIERAYLNVKNAQSQFNAAKNQYDFSRESYRLANEQLQIGASNLVDFLLIKSQLTQSEQALLQAKYGLLLNLKIYDFYRGIPLTL